MLNHTNTFTGVAQNLNLSVTTVVKIFDTYVECRRAILPKIICFDEFYRSRKTTDKYAFVMADFQTNKIIDVYHSRRKDKLDSYFSRIPQKERDNVEYIIIDMWDTYRDLAEVLFKNAKIAVDSFHVIKHLNEAMINIRLRIMRKYEKNTKSLYSNDMYYYMLKKFHYFFVKEFDDIYDGLIEIRKMKTKWDKYEIRKYLLSINSDLKYAYELKEKYKIEQDNILEAYKIMVVRYEISRNGYSSIRPVTIAKDVSRESAVKLGEQSIYFPGISATNEPMVSYPSGSLASHILGYVGNITETELDGREDTYGINDVIGKVGIQYVFEEYLRGKDGIKQLDMSVDGTITDEYITQEAVAGSDVILTIDANLQAATEKALANNIKKIASGGFSKRSDAKAGAAVVMNVKTGEILAMASYPDYEPELFVNGISQKKLDEYNKGDNIFNRAISGVYAPGSTFKMITAIAGLETGVITPTEKINDIGVYKKAHEPACWIWNSYGMSHGWLNVTEAITHSCNYFFYEVGYRATIDNIAKYAKYYGLGEKTNVELPMEEKGIVATRDKAKERGDEWQIGETLSAAIGQSYNSYTPIQMAKYISMLANGGEPIDVTIVKSINDVNGNQVSKEDITKFVNAKLGLTKEKKENLNIKKENIDAILKGMKGVTSEEGGTAYSTFANFNIELGGKTGSAQTDVQGKINGWFVGFAPYEEPEIAVVVLVENAGSGSYTAEVARDILQEYFGMNMEKVEEDLTAMPSTEIQN